MQDFNKGSVNEKTALDKVSLYLDEGEFVTVIGEMGGKSTLINCIAGVYEVDAGHIYLDGEDITYTRSTNAPNISAGSFKTLAGHCL